MVTQDSLSTICENENAKGKERQPDWDPDSEYHEEIDAYDNGSDTSEDDMYLFETQSNDPALLQPDHIFNQMELELSRTALDKFLNAHWRTSSSQKRSREADEEPESRKRVKVATVACYQAYMIMEQTIEADDEDTILVDYPKPLHRNFMCPFYVRDRRKYQTCLARASLLSIEDVKRHLWTAHSQPLYCPICHQTFETTDEQHRHIRSRGCEQGTLPRPEGITIEQMQLLARRMGSWVAASIQWLNVWAIVFPGADPPPMEYHSGETESAIVMLRQYWADQGHSIVADFLDGKDLGEPDPREDASALASLRQNTLNRMVDHVLEVSRQDPRFEDARGRSRDAGRGSVWRRLRSVLNT
ncbi:hypothetical protein BX600DRAFT_522450 [Xylariales sp. PMI_506]|nr:hypothetical protein BX600DRAFT_522450 [Xylariales sp. PMI_506]